MKSVNNWDGIQISKAANIVDGYVEGAQGSYGFNIARGDLKGLQISRGANIARGRVGGTQIGVINLWPGVFAGVQF